jgi:hypothetical protein
MNVKHFGFLSSVFRKPESHEQDGERLRGAHNMRSSTASGDPAMALRSSIGSRERTLSVRALGGSF